ncbi:MAG: DNA polymerase III subunit gamma/tau [Alphaproteobacteria bacterium 32-64-14]|nr:MAG: DNA polymerase III subunit gamma/tau [Alphaproteobacteria bacterium 32-64-14]
MAGKKPPKPPEEGPEDPDTGVTAEPRDTLTASMFGDDPKPAAGPAAYQVLARKYRPTRFEDLVGQEAMVRTLANAFKTGRIAHAFMLTGVRGVGKTTTARLLARALNYESKDVHGPSMQLDPPGIHCAAIMASQHPDVLELDAASNTGIDNMRDLLSGSRYAPVNARYKVYIIDEVHMLSTAAFNALLKTLEEPPPHVKFIFATTEIRKVPVTVLSRCQRFNLQRFSTEQLTQHLANICKLEGAKVSPEALALIARAAEGSARDGLSILDQAIVQGDSKEVSGEQVRDMLGLADRSRVLDLMDRIISGDHKAALEEATSLLEQGADAPVLIKDLMDVVVEISRAQALKEAYAFAGPPDWAKRTQAMGEQMSPALSARMWRMLLQGFEDCARAPDPPAAAEMVVLRLAAAASLPSPEDAARMLAGGAAVPSPKEKEAPKSRPEPRAESAPEPTPQARQPAQSSGSPSTARTLPVASAPIPDETPHHGVKLSSLRQIVAELDARREISLKYEIERYVRPAEISWGHFNYTAAPGAPNNLSQRIKDWLEEVSGVEWEVLQSNDGGPESVQERRRRVGDEKLSSAAALPKIAEALRLFPGSRVLRVDDAEQPDDLDEGLAAPNVIHVDFGHRERTEEEIPDPEEHEDDD